MVRTIQITPANPRHFAMVEALQPWLHPADVMAPGETITTDELGRRLARLEITVTINLPAGDARHASLASK